MMPARTRVALWLWIVGSLGVACSARYDADDFRGGESQGGDGDRDGGDGSGDGDGGGNDAGHDPVIDAGGQPDEADAAFDLPDAGDCGNPGQACCPEEPACQGGEFIECTDAMCQRCGGTLQACCQTGPLCQGLLNCLAGLCVL